MKSQTMKLRRACTIAVAVTAATLGLSRAAADSFLFQWDDTEPNLYGNTYQNGTLIQNAFVGSEHYGGGYGLQWNGGGAVLAHDVDVSFNIYEGPGGALSDTWHLFGTQGSGVLNIPFFSDIEGQLLQPLAHGITMYETGDWQTVLDLTLANGDTFTWQFRSDVESVPDSGATIAMLGLALGGIAAARRKLS